MAETPDTGTISSKEGFRIQRWEVWYVYSFYLSRGIKDLERAALQLAASGLVSGFVLPDGRLGWRNGSAVQITQPSERDTYRSKDTEISFLGHVPEDLRFSMLKLLAMRSAERNIFGITANVPEPSLRVILPQFTVLHESGRTLTLETTGQIFQPGIMLISFQSSVELDISLAEFIDDHVNLNETELKQVYTDVGLGPLLFRAARDEGRSLRYRWSELKERRAFDRSMEDQTRIAKEEGKTELRTILTPETSQHLVDVGQLVVRTMAYILGRPRSGLNFMLLGEPEHPKWTGMWHGSPHVHLIRFSDQTNSAKENENYCREAFKWILARISPSRGGTTELQFPKSARAFDDHGVYISEGAMLWVYTKDTGEPHLLERDTGKAFSLPTCHNQVKGELVEYGNVLYTSILDELAPKDFDWDRVLSIKERQLLFERELSLTGQFGEVRDLLRDAFRIRRFDELRQHAASFISLRESIASVTEDRRLASTAIVIALIVSLLGLGDAVDFLRRTIKPHIIFLRTLSQGSFVESTILGFLVLVFLGVMSWGVHAALRRRRYISWQSSIQR